MACSTSSSHYYMRSRADQAGPPGYVLGLNLITDKDWSLPHTRGLEEQSRLEWSPFVLGLTYLVVERAIVGLGGGELSLLVDVLADERVVGLGRRRYLIDQRSAVSGHQSTPMGWW